MASVLIWHKTILAEMLNDSQCSSLTTSLTTDSVPSALRGLSGGLCDAWGTQDRMHHNDWSSCVPVTTPRTSPTWSAGLRKGFLAACAVFTINNITPTASSPPSRLPPAADDNYHDDRHYRQHHAANLCIPADDLCVPTTRSAYS